MLLGLSWYAAFSSVSGTSPVSGFTRLWCYRGKRQIVAMERKELKHFKDRKIFLKKILCSFVCDSLTNISETFLQDYIIILKLMFQNYCITTLVTCKVLENLQYKNSLILCMFV